MHFSIHTIHALKEPPHMHQNACGQWPSYAKDVEKSGWRMPIVHVTDSTHLLLLLLLVFINTYLMHANVIGKCLLTIDQVMFHLMWNFKIGVEIFVRRRHRCNCCSRPMWVFFFSSVVACVFVCRSVSTHGAHAALKLTVPRMWQNKFTFARTTTTNHKLTTTKPYDWELGTRKYRMRDKWTNECTPGTKKKIKINNLRYFELTPSVWSCVSASGRNQRLNAPQINALLFTFFCYCCCCCLFSLFLVWYT